MFLAGVLGLLCVGAAREGVAEPGAPPLSGVAKQDDANAATVSAGAVGVSNAGTVPLSRSEYLPKLQEFYATGDAIRADSESDKLSDREVDLQFKAFLDWANEAGNWMSDNLSPAATAKFTTWHMEVGDVRKLSGTHRDEENNKFRTLTTVLPQLLDNLRFLMTPGAIDPPKSNAGSPK
jgi:hypothetical protein